MPMHHVCFLPMARDATVWKIEASHCSTATADMRYESRNLLRCLPQDSCCDTYRLTWGKLGRREEKNTAGCMIIYPSTTNQPWNKLNDLSTHRCWLRGCSGTQAPTKKKKTGAQHAWVISGEPNWCNALPLLGMRTLRRAWHMNAKKKKKSTHWQTLKSAHMSVPTAWTYSQSMHKYGSVAVSQSSLLQLCTLGSLDLLHTNLGMLRVYSTLSTLPGCLYSTKHNDALL